MIIECSPLRKTHATYTPKVSGNMTEEEAKRMLSQRLGSTTVKQHLPYVAQMLCCTYELTTVIVAHMIASN